MASQRRPLSDSKIRALSEPGKYTDGVVPGLFLVVTKAGGKVWRLKYRLDGKEGLYSIGRAGEGGVGLAEARQLAQAARSHVALGVAPLAAKAAQKETQRLVGANTFEKVARDWLKHKGPTLAPITLTRYRGGLEGHVFDYIGKKPLAEVRLADVSAVIDRLRDRPGAARHTFGLISQVLDFAELRELVDRNVCTNKRGIVPTRKVVSRAALMDPAEIGGFLRALDAYPGRGAGVVSALRCMAYLPVRPAELCGMRWDAVDLDAGEWRFKMGKVDREHIVPLPSQVVSELRSLRDEGTGAGHVFKSNTHRGRPICRDSLYAGILRLGYKPGELSAHGWRATWRTVGHEVLGIDPLVLELGLGHKMPGSLGEAYNRVRLLSERKAAAQVYANWLDDVKANAVPKA